MAQKLKDTLLLVGDAESDRGRLRNIFEYEYNILEAGNVIQATMLLAQNAECIIAVIADIPFDNPDGIRDLVACCKTDEEDGIPLIALVTPTGTGAQEEYAFVLGATDVVLKPYTTIAIQRRVNITANLYTHKWALEKLVRDQSETIRSTNQTMLDTLSSIIEYRSTESGNHILRIRQFTKILLENIAKVFPEYRLDADTIDVIASASALHDIGKISVPDAILNKPDRLTHDEFQIMKSHSAVGASMIESLSEMADLKFLRYAYNIALYHHERWDGSGYPAGLAGDAIPICAQVVGLADAFDALTTKRVYKPAYPCAQAVNMILNGECGSFSPKLLECFKHVKSTLSGLARRYADGYSPKNDLISIPLPGPVWQAPAIDTLQNTHAKYQALLHYLNDTVMELDFDSKTYHVVYNPDPNFDRLDGEASLSDAIRSLSSKGVHPDDTDRVKAMYEYFRDEFFTGNLRKKTFSYRVYSPAACGYVNYEATLLRVDAGSGRNVGISIWHRGGGEASSAPTESAEMLSSPVIQSLLGATMCLDMGSDLRIEKASGLYTLTGYTKDEIERSFGSSFARLIHPDDLDSVISRRSESGDGSAYEIEYRLMRRDGKPLWVLDKTRVFTSGDGVERSYHLLSDNSRSKAMQRRLEANSERNRIIIEQSDGIVFEWNLKTDSIYCSDKWEKRFGYAPSTKSFGSHQGMGSHFHPDDLPLIRSACQSMLEGAKNGSVDVRISTADGRYLWNKIRGSVRYDAEGSPTGIIGIITDIDELKRTALTMKAQAERDPLTRLLNKASTHRLAADYLSSRSADSLGAMMIIDLDNFKAVNDCYGHLYGDSIISQVGDSLKKLFRPYDIIGRIGGDEFMVVMKDIPGEQMLRDRCALIVDSVRELLRRSVPDLEISCSIGAAMIPAHGEVFSELFTKADESLYRVKNSGKNSWRVYDPGDTAAGDEVRAHLSTRIDSDEQPGIANQSLVRHIFRALYESSDIEATINGLLEYIGKQLAVSRVYIFENSDDNSTCSNTFEWCAEGISPEKDNLQNVSYIDDIAGWPQVYDENGVFHCCDISSLPENFRTVLEPQGIKSMLQCAIMESGVFRGYVGFDECRSNRVWTRDQISLLNFMSEVIAMFLLKKRSHDKAVIQSENLKSVLDSQDAWIYVIDPDTCRIHFSSEKARRLSLGCSAGTLCYEKFMGRSSRCENCPALKCKPNKPGFSILENDALGMTVKSRASLISWDGQRACLITCHDTADPEES